MKAIQRVGNWARKESNAYEIERVDLEETLTRFA